MPYPLLSEYLEAIKSSEDNFKALSSLRPVLDTDCNPVMTSGNFAVVFKMKDEDTGKLYAIKCFTRDQDGRAESYKMIAEELDSVDSSYITHFKYFDKELFVDTANSDETEYPVLQMDWVEGKTLDKYIRENINDQYALEMLAYQFSRLAMWLLPHPFAHGDLKPDNIIVREDGSLVLVDYDGMYVPAMKGQKARELGSPDFRHPSRTADEFNEHIDDFPIASILLSLKAIALQPGLLEEYGAKDRLLLSEADYRNISGSQLFKQVFPSDNMELNKLINLFMLALSENNLSAVSSNLFNLQKPEDVVYSTEVTEEDLANAWVDEFGVKYSADRKRLLKAPKDIKVYTIRKSTKTICNSAFSTERTVETSSGYLYIQGLTSITIPEGVTSIGERAFWGCVGLSSIILPNTLKSIGKEAFFCCCRLTYIVVSDGVTTIGEKAFHDCRKLDTVLIHNNVSIIGDNTFLGCFSLKKIIILRGNREKFKSLLPNYHDKLVENDDLVCPIVTDEDLANAWKDEYGAKYSVNRKRLLRVPDGINRYSINQGTIVICNDAFSWCNSIKTIIIPNRVRTIGDDSFYGCSNLSELFLPNSLNEIGKGAFKNCKSLKRICLPESVISVDSFAFSCCSLLETVTIPKSIKIIAKGVFEQCISLASVTFLNTFLNVIKEGAFFGCHSLYDITLPDSVDTIEQNAFRECTSLTSIKIPYSVDIIEGAVFWGCESLTDVVIDGSVKEIKSYAFCGCKSLKNINISNSVESIGDWAFRECSSLSGSLVFNSIKSIGSYAFFKCNLLKEVVISGSLDIIEQWTFALCQSIQSISLPESVKVISDSAFKGCQSLTKINIPNSITTIGNDSFYGCRALRSIIIPNSVIRIGNEAFSFCSSLSEIVMDNPEIEVGYDIFSECYSLKKIYIPRGSLERFRKIMPDYKHLLFEIF